MDVFYYDWLSNCDAGVCCDDVDVWELRCLRSLFFNMNTLRADVWILARCVLSGTDMAPALARFRRPSITFGPSKRTRQWNGPSRDMPGACGWPQNLVSIWGQQKQYFLTYRWGNTPRDSVAITTVLFFIRLIHSDAIWKSLNVVTHLWFWKFSFKHQSGKDVEVRNVRVTFDLGDVMPW